MLRSLAILKNYGALPQVKIQSDLGHSVRMMVSGLIFAIIANELIIHTQAYQKQGGFKRTEVSCFEELAKSKITKTLIECLGLCLTFDNCEAVQFDGKDCKALTNLTCCIDGEKYEVWVDKRLLDTLVQKEHSSEFKKIKNKV